MFKGIVSGLYGYVISKGVFLVFFLITRVFNEISKFLYFNFIPFFFINFVLLLILALVMKHKIVFCDIASKVL